MRRLALAAGGAVVLLAALDAYVVVTVLLDIANTVGVPVNRLERITPVVTGFLLGYIAAMPLLGQLSDRYGRRPLIHACLAAFAIGSLITALSTGLWTVVAGRALQGIAGGALLPITMALIGDLWQERERPVALGAVGAAQELGSALGPLYGGFLALAFGSWQAIFWINLPLVALAAIAVQLTVPGGVRPSPALATTSTAHGKDVRVRPAPKIDLTGGLLLATCLALLVVGLYNPDPAKAVLPPWGLPLIAAGLAVAGAFVWWEIRSPVRVLDLSGTRKGPLLATLGVSFTTGAALLVTMVFVQLAAQTLLGLPPLEASLVLARFLIALPVAALLGGWLARRAGEWPVTVAGMLLAAVGYVLMYQWPLDLKNHPIDIALIVAGAGLGLVIAPVSSAVLRTTPAEQHGVASAAVVVARMMGMLIGVAAVSSWGFYRFQSLTADLDTPLPVGVDAITYARQMAEYAAKINAALHVEYTEMFLVTGVLCVLGVVLAIFMRER
ncbi:MFS transporter [Nonomuraea soli]|uniref:MFS-type drug efflux transporter P55 n=1 Tax=Nonomuraea soli TaxID=1032476 RepID=A0A7W0HNJ3_9ACTN|nr:MFS transporter [Nonomuraea soli]MBA2889870.1 MFS family permease [Nonomuraea soli]